MRDGTLLVATGVEGFDVPSSLRSYSGITHCFSHTYLANELKSVLICQPWNSKSVLEDLPGPSWETWKGHSKPCGQESGQASTEGARPGVCKAHQLSTRTRSYFRL